MGKGRVAAVRELDQCGKPVRKMHLKTPSAVPRMTPAEKTLIRRMHFDQGVAPARISDAIGRALSSVTRLLAQKKAPNKIGRPRALTEEKICKTALS